MVHDTSRSGEDDLAERTGGEEQVDPVLDRVDAKVESGRDDTALVQATVELDDDLVAAVVVDDLELANVAWRISTSPTARLRLCPRLTGTVWCPPPISPRGGFEPGGISMRSQIASMRISLPET